MTGAMETRITALVLLFAFVLLAFVLVAAPFCEAQPRRQGPPPSGMAAMVDAAVYPGDATGRSPIDVEARIAYADLIFMRTARTHPDSAFAARVTFSVEITDSAGATLASSTDVAEAWVADFADTEAPDTFLLLRRTFLVRSGRAVAHIECSDGNAPQSRRVMRLLRLPDWNAGRPAIASCIPVDVDSSGMPLRASGFGAALLYGRPTYVLLSSTATDGAAWEFELLRRDEDEDEPRVAARATLQPLALLTTISCDTAGGLVRDFAFRRLAHPSAGTLALFRLPFDTLFAGRYELRVLLRQGGEADSLVMPVELLWRDMPVILRFPERTAAVMRYVLTREQIDALDDLDADAAMQYIRAFWKEQDPTPGTEYNERMAEYFRRADEAEERFQTLFFPRGALTDRGRIYILYGEPDAIERVMAPEQPTEERWTYTDISRSFRFLDRERSGNLKLLEP